MIAGGELIEVLRALPSAPEDLDRIVTSHRADAERHGLGGVLFDACRASGVSLTASVEAQLGAREIAREMDHTAHVAMIRRIDDVLHAAGIAAVALKGALLAERLYAHPASRGATDIDLLVATSDLDRAADALRPLGYTPSDDPEEERLRREHHHIHLENDNAIPVELHFHAYRGFGAVLDGASLVARGIAWRDLRAVRVLAPEDELVYLMVHAAAHRFGRLSWLYDIKLLLAAMPEEQISAAAARAFETGYAHVVSLAAVLAIDIAGVTPSRVAPLIANDWLRRSLAGRVAAEPAHPLLRAATRFVYTTALCGDARSAARYAMSASAAYAKRMLPSHA